MHFFQITKNMPRMSDRQTVLFTGLRGDSTAPLSIPIALGVLPVFQGHVNLIKTKYYSTFPTHSCRDLKHGIKLSSKTPVLNIREKIYLFH